VNRKKRNLIVWGVFAAAVLLLLIIVWYVYQIQPAGHSDEGSKLQTPPTLHFQLEPSVTALHPAGPLAQTA
jgi:hypothetical protein